MQSYPEESLGWEGSNAPGKEWERVLNWHFLPLPSLSFYLISPSHSVASYPQIHCCLKHAPERSALELSIHMMMVMILI